MVRIEEIAQAARWRATGMARGAAVRVRGSCRGVVITAFAGCCVAGSLIASAAAPPAQGPRGSQVHWARLVGDGEWHRHQSDDHHLIRFLRRNTTLDVSSTARTARATNLEELCAYPFLYAANVARFSPRERANVAEYLRRGGFILFDPCANSAVTPHLPRFRDAVAASLQPEFPDLRLIELPRDHEVFTIYFNIRERPPQSRQTLAEPGYPLYALYSGDRLLAMVSINAYQCNLGGFGRVATTDDTLQMMANIYIHALTR